jgi:oligopeptide/dipeptide ABC transporter ATP-binding protein
MAMLFISHDIGVVARVADEIAVMYAGRIVERAPVPALFAAAAHPYTQGLLSSIPDGPPRSRLRAIEGTVPPPGARPPGCAFEPRCPHARQACRAAPPAFRRVAPAHEARCVLVDGPGLVGAV